MTVNSDLPGALRFQARACENLGSPFNAAMLDRIADDVESGGPVMALLRPWADADFKRVIADAASLRIVNAFNHLAQSGQAPSLSNVWPVAGAAVDPEAAWRVARAEIGRHRDHLAAFMEHEPQTNEVRRSICLLGGFLTIAAETGLPLRCFELGASAGLNVSWDRFHYDLGAATWGDHASPVRIDTEWTGALPPLVPVEVVERAACDRRPTDLTDPDQRRRLIACIWPDQFERLERSRQAIDLALAHGVRVDADDALEWTRRCVTLRPGSAAVLYHSVFWQYPPKETQEGLSAAIEALAAQAGRDAPFAWLRMEPAPQNMGSMDVRLTLWPGGEERVLAEVHPHGAQVTWL